MDVFRPGLERPGDDVDEQDDAIDHDEDAVGFHRAAGIRGVQIAAGRGDGEDHDEIEVIEVESQSGGALADVAHHLSLEVCGRGGVQPTTGNEDERLSLDRHRYGLCRTR